jgi:hypothetical protein
MLGVLLLVSLAVAIDLTPSTISNSNTGWLVANGVDETTITVTALNTTATPPEVSGAMVAFSLDAASTGLGSLSTVSMPTGTDGKATTKFRTSIKSGDATILATITYNDGSTTPVSLSTVQRVNHGTPEYANATYPAMATVGTIVQFNIELTDSNNNPIDNRNPDDSHSIILLTSTDGDAGLYDGTGYTGQVTLEPDAAGKASVNYRLSTIGGKNYIVLKPLGNINNKPYDITGIGLSDAFFISQSYPIPAKLPASRDPDNFFTIDYSITDKYGNPSSTTLLFTADDGTSSLKTTNPLTGKVRAWFGPRDIIGKYTLHASTPVNASVICLETGEIGGCTQTVEFLNTDPVDLYLTANPQGMASLDVDPASKAIIQAKVVDMMGNPVLGQEVRFSNATPTYPGGPYNETIPPKISSKSATVTGGFATIEFTPGAFTSNGNEGYNATATGEIIVTANWTNPKTGDFVKKDVKFIWKNYPYISISSDSACTNKLVGDTINISVVLSGDGAALRPKPIDVMLITDKSTSMTHSNYNNPIAGPDGPKTKLFYANSCYHIYE